MQTATGDNINIHVPTVSRLWATITAIASVAVAIAACTWTVSQMLNARDARILELERRVATCITREQLREVMMSTFGDMIIRCDKDGDKSTCEWFFKPIGSSGGK